MQQKTTIYFDGNLYFQIDGARRYYISRAGAVLSTVGKPFLMQLSLHPKGYQQVDLYTDTGREWRVRVHRLVAQRFLYPVPGKNHVNHKDGNKHNNRVSNLEWCTNRENVRHAYALKRTRQGQYWLPFWRDSPHEMLRKFCQHMRDY
ncbi:HNH endonuclease signature motif containing protein [Hymenobacter sp. HD11105]